MFDEVKRALAETGRDFNRIRRSGRGSEPRGKSLHRVGQQGLGRTQQATRLTAGADGHADHIHGQIAQALGDIADATRLIQAQPKRDELVVAVLPSFGRSWLLPRLPAFQRLYPHISIRLQATLAITNLHQESVDMAIRMGKGEWEGVEQKLLFHDEVVVVAAPHFNGRQLPRTPEQIVHSPIIYSNESWQPWCQAAGIEMSTERKGLCSNDSNLVLEAVRLGQGIALERRSLVHDAIVRGELVQLCDISAPYAYPYWLAWPPRESSESKQRVFSEWLHGEVQCYMAQLASIEP